MTTMNEEEPVARYVHSTLYKFTTTARAVVLESFHQKLGNITANCSYDAGNDLFDLGCPSSQGAFCDETLRDVISRYIERELGAAEREERKPQVQRFPASQWDWDDGQSDKSDSSIDEHAPPAPAGKPVTAHIVLAKESGGRRLKFFTMPQLPESFLRRSLCAETSKAREVLAYGLTCRTVAWKNGEGFVFNGRDGASSRYAGREPADCPVFPALSDTRDQATLERLGPECEEPADRGREHAGHDKGVARWIQGVSKTNQSAPEEAADLPKETKKLLAADDMRGIGRARVPKGYKPGMVNEEHSSDDERDLPATKPNFQVAMRARSIASDSDSSSNSDSIAKAKSPFSSMLATPQTKPPERMNGWAVVNSEKALGRGEEPDPGQQANSPATPSFATAPRSSIPSSTVPDAAYLNFPDWSNYTRVDNVGLTAHPGLTAANALENFIPTPAKHKPHPLIPRSKKPYAQPNNRSQARTPSAPASVVSTSAATTRSQTQSIVPAQSNMTVSTSRLIDVTSRPSTRPPTVPPGLTTPRQRLPKQPPAQQINSGSLIDASELDLMDRSPTRIPAGIVPPSGQILQPVSNEQNRAVDDDVAIDKLAVFAPDFNRKRNTMNQRAGKNVKSKGKKPTNSNGKKPVELPLPDPLPTPRVRKVIEAPKPSSKDSRLAVPQIQDADLRSINAFSHLLFEIIEKQAMSDNEHDDHQATREAYKLVLQFGQLLSMSDDESFSKQEASSPEVFQQLMNSSKISPNFFPGLTNSPFDASLLLDLTEAGKTPELIYEVLIKDAAGWSLKCIIPANDKARFTVETKDQAAAYEYMHFPEHVWDARMGLMRPGVNRKSPSHEAIAQFVSSMKTHEGEPSFLAYLSPGQFVVETVLAHRIFQDVKNSIVSRVDQIELLNYKSFGGGRYNFRATVLPDIEMIESHRMWWEVCLETYDLEQAEDLRDIATFMVEKMDGVGIENIGPWDPRGETEDQKEHQVLLYDDLGRQHLEERMSRL